ncbi:uncharacterized protein LOC112557745 isoform X2 [Pomacea canaliculata]|nr:uncharacterized protein LOC112557745 isoform X2 [Pomacea canaliculata]XP_025083543.1 uncharacterized protein LOC112557745 isoform X2 [Pomacea canaliculata]
MPPSYTQLQDNPAGTRHTEQKEISDLEKSQLKPQSQKQLNRKNRLVNKEVPVESVSLSTTTAAVAIPPKTVMAAKEEEEALPLEPEDQRKFDTILRTVNALVCESSLLEAANKNVTRLGLKRVLPEHISFVKLLSKLENLQVLDLSGNNMGPQAVRALCLALPPNCCLASLSIADNKTDTDTAECVGFLLTNGPPLVYLDVSGNYLGKDFFSRCVGEALKTNTTLQTLRAQSIGMVDANSLLEGLKENSSLVEIDLSNNTVTDRKSIGLGIAECLKKPNCCLQSLALASSNLNPEGLQLLTSGLSANFSLLAINVSNNEFGSLQILLNFVVTAFSHPNLQNLHLSDAKISDMTVKGPGPPSKDNPSKLRVLSFNSSQVTDDFFKCLSAVFRGRLLHLLDVDLSNNPNLSVVCLEELRKMTSQEGGGSGLSKLTFAMNDMEGLPAYLSPERFPGLAYLNIRKTKLSSNAFIALSGLVTAAGLPLSTLVLDGLKLSGTETLKNLCGNLCASKITALSLSSCSLADEDLLHLVGAVQSGFQSHMLKLSDNRLTDAAVKGLAECLKSFPRHPLSVLDLSVNQIHDEGAKNLCGVYTNKKHTSSLHSLNLANNGIGKEGLLALVACMGGKFPLKCLYVNDQAASFLESEVEEICSKLAAALGFTMKISEEKIQRGCSNLPPLPEGFFVNIRGLGGHTGEVVSALDCPAIVTDTASKRPLTLTLEQALEIAASFQRDKTGLCSLSKEDWDRITGADKDNSIPSWLKLAESRCKALYLSNLPGNSTTQRIEALFEMEADCSIDEVVLTKDPVTRNNSGTGWILFSDAESLKKAVDFCNSGQAQVFGTPFSAAQLKITLKDKGDSAEASKARQDMAERQRARAAEDRAYRQLIQQNTEESWKRHAYRLAHPAYADGRIW